MPQCICNALFHCMLIPYHICEACHLDNLSCIMNSYIKIIKLPNSSSKCQYFRVHISTFNQQLSLSKLIKSKERQLGSQDQLWHKRCPQKQSTHTAITGHINMPQLEHRTVPDLTPRLFKSRIIPCHKHAMLRLHIRPHTATEQS